MRWTVSAGSTALGRWGRLCPPRCRPTLTGPTGPARAAWCSSADPQSRHQADTCSTGMAACTRLGEHPTSRALRTGAGRISRPPAWDSRYRESALGGADQVVGRINSLELHVVLKHFSNEGVEAGLGRPAQLPLRLGRVATQLVDLGRPHIRGVANHIFAR